MNTLRLFIVLIVSLTILVSCSGGNRTPVTIDSQASDVPDSFGVPGGETSRDVLAVYDAVIDTEAGTFTVTPIARVGTYHFPLTQYYPNVLKIVGYGFTPNFWADIKLTHPYPGSGIDGFDPRVIAILPANPGVRFNYPILNAVGNNSVVLEPDGYTKLFDNLGGLIAGNTNPFKAYFKDQPYRVWSSTGVTSETQRWNLNLSGFGGPMQYKLIVDVSTKYPNPPQPVVDNAPEPVEIDSSAFGECFNQDGGSANITVTLLDWQGRMTVGGVQVEAPGLFNGTVSLSYVGPGQNPNEYVYKGTISNEKVAPAGEYKYLVAAWDQATGIYIYNEFKVKVSYLPSQGNLIWAKRAGGSSYEEGFAITTLYDNSTVVTGYFFGTATFGAGESNQIVLTSPGYAADIFIARYNSDGSLSWAKRAGGWGGDYGRAITTLSDNSIVVTGDFWYTATFGPGEPNQTILTSAGYADIFVARYNPDGTLSWAKRAGGSNHDDQGYGNTTLSDNSTVVTGRFEGTVTFGPGEPNQTILTSAGYRDIFIARYNPDGTLSWAKRAGGTNNEYGLGISTLSDNSTVVTGAFGDNATFGPDEPNETVLWSAGWADIFIARYNTNGMLSWAKRAGGWGGDYGRAITMLSDSSTVVTGTFGYSATFGPGESNETVLLSAGGVDVFIARYNPDGKLAWAKCAGGPSDNDYGRAITTLSDNSTVITGAFCSSATFGPSEPNQTVLISAGYEDIFIALYNPNGTLSWAKRTGGSNMECAYGITTLSYDSFGATGYFMSSTATFGPCELNETILTSAGGYDIFIARFEP